jgi:hypothetical protein
LKATPKDTWSKTIKKTGGKIKAAIQKPIQAATPAPEAISPAKSWNEMLLELLQSFIKFANKEKKAKRTR